MTKPELTISIKLFSGLEKEAGIKTYDHETGIILNVKYGIQIRKIIKGLKIPGRKSLAYFINGEQVTIHKKLQENCELVCLKPTAGG